MIGTSTGEYVFIRACVTFLHYIAPFSVFYSLSLLASQLLHQDIPRFPFFIEIWLAVEAVFFIFVFHPHKVYLQRAAVHPAPPPRTERKKLFELCKRNVSDPEAYIRGWFKGAPLEDVGRDGVKLFLAWGFLNKGTVDAENEEELQEYLREMEEIIGPDFRFGNGKAQPLRLTFDPIDLLHRSLWWYLVSLFSTPTRSFLVHNMSGATTEYLCWVPSQQSAYRCANPSHCLIAQNCAMTNFC